LVYVWPINLTTYLREYEENCEQNEVDTTDRSRFEDPILTEENVLH
jgi:hypothetical protein